MIGTEARMGGGKKCEGGKKMVLRTGEGKIGERMILGELEPRKGVLLFFLKTMRDLSMFHS